MDVEHFLCQSRLLDPAGTSIALITNGSVPLTEMMQFLVDGIDTAGLVESAIPEGCQRACAELITLFARSKPMDQDTKPAPFNMGDHVRYIGAQTRKLATGRRNKPELVLAPGMVGVVVLSTAALSRQDSSAPNAWHCRVQFQNGFQLDIAPENRADFARTCNEKETVNHAALHA
jgi:hypothetical protein